ncbi:hypothetical protein MtrunA17_Chr3g0094431 [Medicago truncatula]|uniref:Uncharacterized protein n=1 Tax=Medicago truncatula TaxID=3880 RepID=A0A396IMC5_MEDTR|nr:hypothetical protein MtrunA17_Chr3g0094431 [Medicago truncatula]
MDYCGWAASFCYSFKLQLCGLVIGCCWSSFGLDLLQDVATTKDYAEVSQARTKEDKQASLQFKVLKK